MVFIRSVLSLFFDLISLFSCVHIARYAFTETRDILENKSQNNLEQNSDRF